MRHFIRALNSLHSTETALVRVLNDILMATDSVILVMRDLSSAFNTANREFSSLAWSVMWVGGGGKIFPNKHNSLS